jgi:PAS domain S-box-containing protein
MNDSSFAEQVSEALQRVMKLRLRAQRASGGEVAEAMAEALEELGVVFEELQVAQEELRVRNEALATAEAAAAAERNRFRDLFEFAPNGYVVTDAEGLVHQANRAACGLLQITPRFLAHKPLTVFVAPEDRTAFLGQLSGLQRGEPVWEQTVRFQPRAEGCEPRVVDLTVVPFRDPETQRPMLRWQMRDVTEQWQATEAVRKWNEELEARVRARTAELEKALREKEEVERLLRLADRRKDEFLAILAHEFRNPLTPLRYAAHILHKKCPPGSDLDHPIGVVVRQTEQLSHLVDDLADVSRVVQGKIRLNPEPIDLAEAARAAVEGVRERATARGVELQFAAPDQPVMAQADPTRLDQVFANLLTNAVKYTDRGGTVAVWVAREGDKAAVRVRDTGVGIPPEVLPRLFDLFIQDDRSTTHAQGGLGIGLHLVKLLTELHGGSVAAHSDGPGKGSEFVVRLPATAGQAAGKGE